MTRWYIDKDGAEVERGDTAMLDVEFHSGRYTVDDLFNSTYIELTGSQILALARMVKRDRLEAEIAPLRGLSGRELAAKYWQHEISTEAFSAAVDDLARRTGREANE